MSEIGSLVAAFPILSNHAIRLIAQWACICWLLLQLEYTMYIQYFEINKDL